MLLAKFLSTATLPPRGLGGVVTPIPLRTVVTNNRGNIGSETRSETHVATRWQYMIANACSELVVSNSGFGITGGSSEFNQATDFTILEQSLEIGGVSFPVTYSGGRTLVVTSGAVDLKSDPVYPALFALADFSYGTAFFIKTKIDLGGSGRSLIYSAETIQSGLGQQAWWYNAANTTVASADAVGVFTSTGTTPAGRATAYRPQVWGRPLVDSRSFVVVGDSIAQNFNDPSGNPVIHGGGFVNRAMHDALASTGLLPCLNLARSASNPTSVIGAYQKSRQLYKYARFGIEEHGTNGGSRADLQTIWSQMRAEGVEKILRTMYFPRTNSTDQWATEVNQTPTNVDWDVGGEYSLRNAWFLTLIGTELDVVFDTVSATAVVNGGSRINWRYNGTANYCASDNTHPSGTCHELVAVDLRPILRSATFN